MTSSTHQQITNDKCQSDTYGYLQPLASSMIHPTVQLVKAVELSKPAIPVSNIVTSSIEEPNFGLLIFLNECLIILIFGLYYFRKYNNFGG